MDPDFDDTPSEQELIDGLLPHGRDEGSDDGEGEELLGEESLIDPEREEHLKILFASFFFPFNHHLTLFHPKIIHSLFSENSHLCRNSEVKSPEQMSTYYLIKQHFNLLSHKDFVYLLKLSSFVPVTAEW